MERRETFLTAGGLSKLEGELDHLRSAGRQEVAQRIQRAKEIGGTVDNSDYEEAKNEQAFIEGRILTVGNMIKSAVVIPEDRAPSDKVEVGSEVTVVNPQGKTQTYHIVGSTEADPSQGMISNESPVGSALLGHKVGDEAEVTTPAGTIKLSLVKVD